MNNLWNKFTEKRPHGKCFIMVSDGKHLSYMKTYKEDWLEEWDNENPIWLTEGCQLCCHESFNLIYWISGWDLIESINNPNVTKKQSFDCCSRLTILKRWWYTMEGFDHPDSEFTRILLKEAKLKCEEHE